MPTYARKSNSILRTYTANRQVIHIYDSDLLYDNVGVRDRQYKFDEVFPDSVSNEKVYAGTLQPLIECVRTGFNVTCFAYGMTGAGKTHTMFGSNKGQSFSPGIANLAIDDLFVTGTDGSTSEISVSFLEIYNEQVKDLLRNSQTESSLQVVEDPQKGVFVPGLQEFIVQTPQDLQKLIQIGNDRRTMAPTNAN